MEYDLQKKPRYSRVDPHTIDSFFFAFPSDVYCKISKERYHKFTEIYNYEVKL